jgi:hypothetical protein
VEASNLLEGVTQSGEEACAVALVGATPLDRLEDVVRSLKQCRSAAEVRKAMVERIARAPFAEFETLKHIYLKHCGDAPR